MGKNKHLALSERQTIEDFLLIIGIEWCCAGIASVCTNYTALAATCAIHTADMCNNKDRRFSVGLMSGDVMYDQLPFKEYIDPFTGSKISNFLMWLLAAKRIEKFTVVFLCSICYNINRLSSILFEEIAMTYSCVLTYPDKPQETQTFEIVGDLYQFLVQHKSEPDVRLKVSKTPNNDVPVVTYMGTVGEFLSR